MQYIHLNDDSYILHTSKGVATLNRKMFNFNKIKRLISNSAAEEKILPLLEPPKLPDGLYEAYLHQDTMYIKHTCDTADDCKITWNKAGSKNLTDSVPDAKFMGVYTSEDELIADWPEYLL